MSSTDSSSIWNASLPEHCFEWKPEDEEEYIYPPEDKFGIDDETWCPWIQLKLESERKKRLLEPITPRRNEEPQPGPSGIQQVGKRNVESQPTGGKTRFPFKREQTSDQSWNSDATEKGMEFCRPFVAVPMLSRLQNQLRGDKLPEYLGRIRDRFPKFTEYRLIEVVDFTSYFTRPEKGYYPTEWLAISNPYWQKAIETAPRKYFVRWTYFYNPIDKLDMYLQRQLSGDLWAKRCGVTVVIEYARGGKGGFKQPIPLLIVNETTQQEPNKGEKRPPTVPTGPRRNNRRPKKPEVGVPTAYIEKESPYWRRLLFNMLQPREGISIRISSEVDGVLSIVSCEADGSIFIRRLFQRVQLLGPLMPGELLDKSIPWGEEDSF